MSVTVWLILPRDPAMPDKYVLAKDEAEAFAKYRVFRRLAGEDDGIRLIREYIRQDDLLE